MTDDLAGDVIHAVVDAHTHDQLQKQAPTNAEFAYGFIVPQSGRLNEAASVHLDAQADILNAVLLAEHLEKGFPDIDRVYERDRWVHAIRNQLGLHAIPVIPLGTVMVVVSDTHVMTDSSFTSIVFPARPTDAETTALKWAGDVLVRNKFFHRNFEVVHGWNMWSYVTQ